MKKHNHNCRSGLVPMLLPPVAILALASVVLLMVTPIAWGQDHVRNVGFVPVLTNIYPNAVVNANDTADVVRGVNRAFRANGFPVRLVPVRNHIIGANDGGANNWGGDNGDGGGAAGDGDLTEDEAIKALNYGDGEVAKLSNHRGIKISFVRTPTVWIPGNPGVAVHCRPTIFVSMPKAWELGDKRCRNEKATQLTVEVAVHEIGHVLTLCSGHSIAPGVNADMSGHAPNVPGPNGNNNAMASGDHWTGAMIFTPAQIDEMWRGLKKHGKVITIPEILFPPVKLLFQFGVVVDSIRDQQYGGNPVSSIYDLQQVYLTSVHESDTSGEDTNNISAQLRVAGVLPSEEEIEAKYTLGFDIDNDSNTGVIYSEHEGIDRIVIVEAHGNISLETFTVEGYVYDANSGVTEALPEPPTVETEYRFVTLDEPAEPVETSFFFDIPKILLDLSADYVPVVATAGIDVNIFDTAEFLFDTKRWLHDPTLSVSGTGVPTRGQPYTFEISGLEPDSPFTLYLDDEPILSDTADPNGGYTGAFIFPVDGLLSEIHFLTAQDITGEFAYNVSPPDPALAWNPNPTYKATDVERTPTLTWEPGIYAVAHDVYFGADEATVTNANRTNPLGVLVSQNQDANTYNVGILAVGKTYYWRIDEVNDLDPNSPWRGDVWKFTTVDYLVVDDFESYTETSPYTIYETWIDGYINGTGSIIGLYNPPYVERIITYGGWQSMPYYYDNDGTDYNDYPIPAYYSEAEADTSKLEIGSDWDRDGVKTLTLYFYGGPNSVGGGGSPVAWGSNDYGQCDVPSPNTNFTAIAAGGFHSLGLRTDGSIVAWGGNDYGECTVPEPNTGFTAIAAGGFQHSLGLKQDGSIAAWGYNVWGECDVPEPNTGFTAIAAGYTYSLGLKTDSSIVAWGGNLYGQCDVPLPNTGFTAIAAGAHHSLGLKQDGSIVAWGWNDYGQCDVPSPNTGFVAIAAGWVHSLGLKQDGSIVTWGWDREGQCTLPSPNTGFTAIAAGYHHSLGLKQDGSIVAWGRNVEGQCTVPEPNTGFMTISGSGCHSLALKNDASEPMYVALEDDVNAAVVYYGGDLNDIKEPEWHGWDIELTDFTGVDLNNVKKVYIGFGTRGNLTMPGGSGLVFFDELRLYPQNFAAKFVIVDKERVGRTLFRYTCKVILNNLSPGAVKNVELNVVKVPDNMTIIDSDVTFDYIEAGESATSDNTCSFEVDRSQAIVPSEVIWQVTYEIADTGEAGQQMSSTMVQLEPIRLAGDITGEGDVNLEDLKVLAKQWLQPPGAPSADIAPTPADGIVNLFDYAVLAEHWLEGL